MSQNLRLALILACTQVFMTSAEASDKLHVMLQGGSSLDLRDLVEENGGNISHELPLIDAVGAWMTPRQLQTVLESPLVIRYIDDLLVKEPEDPETGEEAETCTVEGALQLDIVKNGISWRLYNLQPSPANVQSLNFAWPIGDLGEVRDISLGDATIDSKRIENLEPGKLAVNFRQGESIQVAEQSTLKISFSGGPGAKGGELLQQQDFSISASFHEDCSVKLLPAYADNHNDFYYATVSAADALHKHGITGKGVTVAVLDSGLWEHEKLSKNTAGKARVLARYDAIKDIEGQEVFDESGHGSHMTSIIAHSGPTLAAGEATGGYKGIAPDVDLIAIKAFNVVAQGALVDNVLGL